METSRRPNRCICRWQWLWILMKTRLRRGNQRITRAEIRLPPNKAEGRFLAGIADLGRLTDGQMHIPTWGQYRGECQRETAPEKAAGVCCAERCGGAAICQADDHGATSCRASSPLETSEEVADDETSTLPGNLENSRVISLIDVLHQKELHRSQYETTKKTN